MSALCLGFDIGTYNLILCAGAETGNPVYHTQVNAYLPLANPSPSTKKTLQSLGKPVLPIAGTENGIMLLGRDAIDMASDFGTKCQRPMKLGCVSDDQSSYPILAAMIHGMLSKVTMAKDTVLYYSKPANAISADTNVDLHGMLLQGIFSSYPMPEGCQMRAFAMNEASAILHSDCNNEREQKTGLAVSTGAGMVNINFSRWGEPIFSFSIPNSGDYIDSTVAKATGMSEAAVNIKKVTVDISKVPTNQFELILKAQYELLIRSSIEKIVEGVNNSQGQAAVNTPIPLVVAGGVSGIEGFMPMFEAVFNMYRSKLKLEVSVVRRAQEGVKAIAHGLWEAARNHG